MLKISVENDARLFAALFFLIGVFSSTSTALSSISLVATLAAIVFFRLSKDRAYCAIRPSGKWLLALLVVHFLWYPLSATHHDSFKSIIFLAAPLFLARMRIRETSYLLSGFLVGMAVSETYSYIQIYMKWSLLKDGQYNNDLYLAMGHISYNVFLAYAIPLAVVHTFSASGRVKSVSLWMAGLFAISGTVNMFLTGGRAGMILFISIIPIVLLFSWRISRKLTMICSVVLLVCLSIVTTHSPVFQARSADLYNSYAGGSIREDSSVGKRLEYLKNSLDIIMESPVIGYGTGSFRSLYEEKTGKVTHNPHNFHALILIQFGIIGFLVYIGAFAQMALEAYKSTEVPRKVTGLILPIGFMIINFSDTYLWGHHTQILFLVLYCYAYAKSLGVDVNNYPGNSSLS